MKKAKEFIYFALSHANHDTIKEGYNPAYSVGDGGVWCYIWGTTGTKVTEQLIQRKWDEHYSTKAEWQQYGKENYKRLLNPYIGSKATDCQGLLDSFLGTDINAHACYSSWCTDKGKISEIKRPYKIGEAVFRCSSGKMVHIGFICGFTVDDVPLVVEARSTAQGVGVWKLTERNFTHRGLVTKKLDYTEESMTVFELKSPMESGEVYKAMQEALAKAGYTDNNDLSLNPDGKWGAKSQAAFDKLIAAHAHTTEATVVESVTFEAEVDDKTLTVTIRQKG